MTKSFVCLAVLSIAIGLAACGSDIDEPWALHDVTVVDVREGTTVPERTLLIRGTRIVAVLSSEGGPPTGLRSVDGTGGFVIPGLFDMHAHMVGVAPGPTPIDPMRYLRVGVLGLRDLGAPVDSILAFQRRLATSTSPRAWFTGPILDSLPRDLTHLFMQVASPARASEAVDLVAENGWVSVKVSDWIPLHIYTALAREARIRGVPLAGHVPHDVPLSLVIEAEQRSIEHLGGLPHGILRACSRNRPPAMPGLTGPTESDRYLAVMSSDFISPLVDGFDEERCRGVARQLAAAEVWQVPNLTLWRFWAESPPAADTPENRAAFERVFRLNGEIVRLMAEEGVPIMTGIDEVPGASIHDELQLLVSAGLSPLEALRSATIRPAEFLAVSDSLGSLFEGGLADFLVLDQNPLDDISATSQIRSIALGGELFDLVDGELIQLGRR
ncbi:MAG: amidohydrolase family protein [Longimicrobiales bacterium]